MCSSTTEALSDVCKIMHGFQRKDEHTANHKLMRKEYVAGIHKFHVQCSPSQIKYQNILFFRRTQLLIKPISNGCCNEFIDDSQSTQPNNEANVPNRLSL